MRAVIDSEVQARVRADLLAWDQPRPTVEPAVVARLRGAVEAGLARAAAIVPQGERLVVGKSALDALVCDGRYLDRDATPFQWSLRAIRGTLTHKAIEADWQGGRTDPPAVAVDWAWKLLASATGSLADALNELDPPSERVLRGEAEQDLLDLRAAWPLLPAGVDVRFEPMLRVTSADQRVVIQGVPDLVLGRVDHQRARMLVLDFKTGQPRPDAERQEARFYALLATLRWGVPPFRWGVYNVPENSWTVEDFDEQLLRSAVRRIADGALRAAELTHAPGAEKELRLVAGPWCNWCSREPFCDTAQDRARDRANA